MPRRTRPIATLAAVLALAAPAVAMAKGAGDEQYADPFGQLKKKSPQGGSNGSNGSSGQSQQQQQAAPAQSQPQSQQQSVQPAVGSGQQLPVTGAPVLLLAGAGAGLLGGGALLRRLA